MGAPSMYSITKYGRPLAVAPASKIWAMFGWSIIASAWRSLTKDALSAEVVITGCRRRCIDGLGSGFVRANGTLESAPDQTLRAQSGGITGTQWISALRAVWHFRPQGPLLRF